jgi:hypothetical protein
VSARCPALESVLCTGTKCHEVAYLEVVEVAYLEVVEAAKVRDCGWITATAVDPGFADDRLSQKKNEDGLCN